MTNDHEPQQRDRLPFARIVGVGAVAVLIGIAAVAWSARMNGNGARQVTTATSRLGPAVDAVESSLMQRSHEAADLRQRQLQDLARWAWVDRDRGIVSMPVDTAMDVWLERTRSSRSR
jgi:hypothetical protein